MKLRTGKGMKGRRFLRKERKSGGKEEEKLFEAALFSFFTSDIVHFFKFLSKRTFSEMLCKRKMFEAGVNKEKMKRG